MYQFYPMPHSFLTLVLECFQKGHCIINLLKNCTCDDYFFMHLNDDQAVKDSRFKYLFIQNSKNSIPFFNIDIAQSDNNEILIELRFILNLWKLLEFFC